jgi:hypothetical protein
MNGFDIRAPRPIFMNLSARLEERNLSRFVQSLHTNKTLSWNAGTWEVYLVPEPSLTPANAILSTVVFEFGKEGVTKENWESAVYRSIRPMDAVILGMHGVNPVTGKAEDQTIMFGFVDNVYKRKVTSGDTVQRGIAVRGRDATMLFIEDVVALAPELATDSRVKKFFDDPARVQFMDFIRGFDEEGKNVFLDSYLPKAMYWILAKIPSMRIVVDYLGGMKKPFEIFRTSLIARAEDKIYDEKMNMYAGAVINYMVQLIEELFYELWVDTVPAKTGPNTTDQDRPCLFLRPKPYDHNYEVDSDGNELKQDAVVLDEENPLKGDGVKSGKGILQFDGVQTWEELTSPVTNQVEIVGDEEITQKALGITHEEVFTMFKVFGSKDPLASSIIGKLGLYFPLIDGHMLQMYGMRELQGASRLLPSPLDVPMRDYPTGLSQADFSVTNDGFFVAGPPFEFESGGASYERFVGLQQQSDVRQLNTKKFATFMTKIKRDRLWRWNRYNHILESGQLTIKGRRIWVGSKVYLKDEYSRGIVVDTNRERKPQRGMEFYCVSVDHRYDFGNPWLTRLGLIRGHNAAELRTYHDARGFNKPAGSANGIFAAEGITYF